MQLCVVAASLNGLLVVLTYLRRQNEWGDSMSDRLAAQRRFVRVMRPGNFSRAARELALSRPSARKRSEGAAHYGRHE
jgi:hypothetical protein